MNPCLEESSILEFETRFKVRLPEDFRTFLRVVGNGGAGPPFYDLVRLGEIPEDYGTCFGVSATDFLEGLHRPFPFTEHWVWEGEPDEKPGLHEAIHHGNLVLGTEGCAMFWLLVVNGPQRGQIWYLADVGIQPCAPPR